MGFITATPPKNAQYLDAYNALVYSCQMHGIGNALAIKNEGGSITQVDLQGIRNAIWNEARAIYFDASKLDLSLEEPFEKEDAKIEINAGKGFLVMPGKYTSTGKSVYSTGAFGGQQVPVLWEHFTDLANILNSLSSKKADYYAKIEVDKQKAKVDIFVTRGESITNSHGERNYNSDTKKNTEEWTISYTSTTPHDYDTGNTFEFYYHLTSCTGTENRAWQRLSGFTQTDILKLDVNKIIPTIKANTPEADEWIGYCHLQPVCHINYQVTLFNPSVYEDEIENGVAQEGCGNCCNLIANKYNYLKDSIKQFSGRVDFPLAISSDPLQIGHFMATFRYAGSLYGQYNCDTCIEDEFSADSMSDEEGGIASWHFCFLRRPTGALVAFHWQDTETDGIPLNGFGYRLEKKNGGYRLRFPNGYRHVFHGTILHSCQYENGSEKLETVIPGSYVQRSGEGTNFTFSSPVTGQVQLVVNSRSVPVNQYNNVDLPALKRHQLEEDEIPQTANELIREVRTSEDLSDAAGFNFTDFFQTGESPEFGEGEKCRVMEFYNPQNQLLGKYIEMTFDSGILAKGFWNREENELCPVELSMFEQMQQATNINQNLEKQTHIKYSSNGRNQAVTWRLKEKFLFGEQVIADYRNYENEEERQTAVYEYGTTAGSGSYGKLVFTRDFNGTWTRYEYDSYGRQSKIISPFGDAEENATESFCRVVTYDYTPLNENEDIFPQDTRPRTIITKVLGVEISREYHLYFENETWDIKAHAAGALYNAPGNQVTKNYSYATGDFIGRHWKTENYNGTSSVTTYEKINITTDDSGTESYDLKTTTESGFLPESGTREITVQDPAGHIVSREAYDVASNLQISGSTYTYDQFGRVLTETTVDGDVTETEYNCCGPRFMTAPDGTVTEYAYDVFNRVRFESVAGVTTYHTYDANDNEIQTVTEGKEGEEFTSSKIYSDDGLLLNETDAAGAVTSYAYGIGFEIVTDALGGIQRTDYYVDGQLKAISGTAALGKSYEYSVENGELCTKEIASEMEWSKVYTNFLGQTYKTVYPDQFVQTTVYDSLGYVKAIENSLGQKILQIYDDESGNLKYSVVKRGGTSDAIDWNNDSVTEYWSGYQLQDTMVVNRSSTYQYHDNVRVEISRNESSRDGKQTWNMQNGQTTHFERIFESEGEILEVTTNFDGRTVTNRFLEGILQESIDSVLGTTTYAYDEFNRQIGNDHTENGNPISLRLTLDAVGRTLSSTQVSGESSRTTTYVYDSLGRKTAETTPEGITTNYGYTTRGELASITGSAYKQSYTYDLQGRMATLTTWRNDDAPQVTAFEYNCRGWLFRKVYPDNTFETYAYRGDGKIALKTNVRNQVLEYSYNQAGELTALTSGDSVNRSFEYNLNGYLTKVTDTDGIRTFTVDVYGRILSETSATPEGISVARSFDSLQRLAKLSLNEIETEFTYDADGRLASISYGNATLNYAYADGTSLVANRTWKIGEGAPFLTLANTYDVYSRLQGIALNNRQEITYILNDDDRRTGTLLADGSEWNYAYDSLGQVTGAVRNDSDKTPLNTRSFVYDQIGNRISAADDVGQTFYTANSLNQYTEIDQQALTYDADGNLLTTDDGWSYTWNAENRLIKAEQGTVKLEFAYDYMGRRYAKKVYAGETLTKHQRFVYDGYKLLGIYDMLNNGILIADFVWQPESVGLDVPLCMTYNAVKYFFIVDGNKNVIGLVDSTGTRVATYIYGPFGEILSMTGDMAEINPFRFSSEFHDDETGLIYYNYRYYCPRLGRWIKRDPIGEDGGMNLYAVMVNNMIYNLDILGFLKDGQEIKSIIVKKKDIYFYEIIKEKIIKEPSEQDTYGHWWIEMGKESYGWWPEKKLSGIIETVKGVGGILNGVLNGVGIFKDDNKLNTDPHHGDKPDSQYHPRVYFTNLAPAIFTPRIIRHGKAKGMLCKCVTEEYIRDGIRAFANSYQGGWRYPGYPNCHTFVEQALDENCLNRLPSRYLD